MGLFCLFPSFAIRSTIDCFSVAGDWTLGRFVSIPTMEARLSMKARQGPQLDRWARNLSSREGGKFPFQVLGGELPHIDTIWLSHPEELCYYIQEKHFLFPRSHSKLILPGQQHSVLVQWIMGASQS